jgi:hypothetical protein
MKKLLFLTALAISVAMVQAEEVTTEAAPAAAETAPAAEPAPTPTERMTVAFVGSDRISVRPGDGRDKSIEPTRFRVTPETVITINGQPGELSQLKFGHRVVITPVAGQPDVAAQISR